MSKPWFWKIELEICVLHLITDETIPKSIQQAYYTYGVTIYLLSWKAKTIQIHFTLEVESLRAHKNYHGWKVHMNSYMVDYK